MLIFVHHMKFIIGTVTTNKSHNQASNHNNSHKQANTCCLRQILGNKHNNRLLLHKLPLGCKIGKIPFVYLGLPIGSSMTKEVHWTSLYEKFTNKLSAWKEKCLSLGGKITLCKSVLGSLGVYLFSLYKSPGKVLRKLERIRKGFFGIYSLFRGCVLIHLDLRNHDHIH